MLDIEAVVFDMDGVLFDTERLYTVAWLEVAKLQHIENIEEPVLKCVGRNEHDTREIMLQQYGRDFAYDVFRAEVTSAFKQMVENDGLPMMKGVMEILNYLKDNSIRIALASSSKSKSVLNHLDLAGIRSYFEQVVSGDMVTHGKPEPDIYRMACEKLGVAPERAIAIEDSYNGICAAYSAGMFPIMVPDMLKPTREMEEKSYAICDSLLDVIQLIRNERE